MQKKAKLLTDVLATFLNVQKSFLTATHKNEKFRKRNYIEFCF